MMNEKPEIVKVEGNESLVRDTRTNAVLNTDLSALDKYRRHRDAQRELREKVQEIDTIKQDIAEIKELLLKLAK